MEEVKKNKGQEKRFQEFLRQENIGFIPQKVWRGYGDKKWITDFYLPQSNIIVECKDYSRMKKYHRQQDAPHFYQILQMAYKDLYKLDELGELYNLTKVFYVESNKNIFPLTFIKNITAHKIYLMTNETQILPIIQGVELLKSNKDQYKKEKQKIDEIHFGKEQQKIRKKFNDETMQKIWDWGHGKTAKELGLHSMQLNRLMRSFVCKTLKERFSREPSILGYT